MNTLEARAKVSDIGRNGFVAFSTNTRHNMLMRTHHPRRHRELSNLCPRREDARRIITLGLLLACYKTTITRQDVTPNFTAVFFFFFLNDFMSQATIVVNSGNFSFSDRQVAIIHSKLRFRICAEVRKALANTLESCLLILFKENSTALKLNTVFIPCLEVAGKHLIHFN